MRYKVFSFFILCFSLLFCPKPSHGQEKADPVFQAVLFGDLGARSRANIEMFFNYTGADWMPTSYYNPRSITLISYASTLVYTPDRKRSVEVWKIDVPGELKYWESEFQSFGLIFPYMIATDHFVNSVYPAVMFKTKAAFDAFYTDKAGALPWSSINRDDIYDGAGDFFFRSWKSWPQPSANDNVIMTRGVQWDEGAYKGMVIEQQPWIRNAVGVKIDMENPIEMASTEDEYTNTENRVLVTYTNMAPYPVTFMAFQPQLNDKALVNADYKDLELYYIKEASSPEIAEGPHYYDSYTYDGVRISGACFPITLLPHEQRTLAWAVKLQHKERVQNNVYFHPYPPVPSAMDVQFGIIAPVKIQTTTPANIIELGGEEIFSKILLTLPGYEANSFAVLDAYPLALNSSASKKLYLVLQNANLRGAIRLINGEDTTSIASTHIQETATSGVFEVNLDNYIGANANTYALLVSNDLGDRHVSVPFTVSANVTEFSPDDLVKRLVIAQHSNGSFKAFTGEFSGMSSQGYSSNRILLDITGSATKIGDNKWTLSPGAVINGVVTVRKGFSTLQVTSNEVQLSPDDDASGVYYTFNGNYFPIAQNGNYFIKLTSDEMYQNTPPEEEIDMEGDAFYDDIRAPMIEFKRLSSLNLLGDAPVAECPGVYLFRNSLSVGGNIALENIVSGWSNIFRASLDLHDMRFDPTGLKGIRADAHGFFGMDDPFGILTTGGEIDIWMNTVPEALTQRLGASGAFNLAFIAGVEGMLEFATIRLGGLNLWSLNSMSFAISGPIPLGPTPITINKLGLGVTGLAESMSTLLELGKGENFIPALNLQGTGGIGVLKEVVNLEGTMKFGISEYGISDGGLSIVIVPILQDMYFLYKVQDLDNNWRFNIGNTNVSLPMMRVSGHIGGKVNLLNIIVGEASGTLGFNPGNISESDATATLKAMYDAIDPTTIGKQKLQSGALIADNLWKMVDFEIKGRGALQVPQGLPLGGWRIAEGDFLVNKSLAKASVTGRIKVGFTLFGKFVGVDKSVTVDFGVSFSPLKPFGNIQTKALPEYMAGMPLYDKYFEKVDNNGQVFYFNSFNCISMVQNKVKDPTSKAFTGEFYHTQTQTMQPLSNMFTIAVRSKSNTAGLLLACDNGIEAQRTAEDMNWQLAENGEYYIGTVALEVPAGFIDSVNNVELTIAGEWQVKAANSDATAFDENGLIDCDFFYTVAPSTISDVVYDYDGAGDITWTNNDLAATANYRVNFNLVNINDSVRVYPVGATEEWLGESPSADFILTKSTLESMLTIPSGEYYLEATLQRSEGTHTIIDSVDDAEEHIAWQMISTGRSLNFTHTNPKEPTAPATNIVVTTVNGSATISWNAPADMSNVNGYHIYALDIDGNVAAQFKVDSLTTTLRVNGDKGKYVWEVDEDNNYIKRYEPVAIEYDSAYKFIVVPYYLMNSETEATIDGPYTLPEDAAIIETPNRPGITHMSCYIDDQWTKDYIYYNSSGYTPNTLDVGNLTIRADHNLFIATNGYNPMSEMQIRISEELTAFTEAYPDSMIVELRDITSQCTFEIGNYNILIPFIHGTDTIQDGLYLLECKLTRPNGDYSVFSFRINIDNTPPMLMVGSRTLNEEGEWMVSGATEANAILMQGEKEITTVGGSFSIPVLPDQSSFSLTARDLAGNVSSLAVTLAGLPQLPDGDYTSSVKIDFKEIQLKLGSTLTATSKVLREGSYVTPEANTIEWTVVKGNALTIDPQSGLITPVAEGDAIIQASYLGALKDVALVTIASEFPINDLYVLGQSEAKNTDVKLSFTEPMTTSNTNYSLYSKSVQTNKEIWYSTDKPVDGFVTTGWTRANAVFHDDGTATISGLDTDKTYYFQVRVDGGFNSGVSNTAGKMGNISSALETVEKMVIFTGESIELDTVWVDSGETVSKPSPDPTRAEYTFKGWYHTDTLYDFNTPVVEDIILTALWESTSSIEDDILDEQIQVYPNPAKEMITISGLEAGDIINIIDITGRNIYLTKRAVSSEETLAIDKLNAGVYFISIIRHNEKIGTLKFVKEK